MLTWGQARDLPQQAWSPLFCLLQPSQGTFLCQGGQGGAAGGESPVPLGLLLMGSPWLAALSKEWGWDGMGKPLPGVQ